MLSSSDGRASLACTSPHLFLELTGVHAEACKCVSVRAFPPSALTWMDAFSMQTCALPFLRKLTDLSSPQMPFPWPFSLPQRLCCLGSHSSLLESTPDVGVALDTQAFGEPCYRRAGTWSWCVSNDGSKQDLGVRGGGSSQGHGRDLG